MSGAAPLCSLWENAIIYSVYSPVVSGPRLQVVETDNEIETINANTAGSEAHYSVLRLSKA